jgi:hypothetical protein
LPVVTHVLDHEDALGAASENPRRSVSTPSTRSAKIARTPRARATSWPMIRPPSAGDSTTCGSSARTASANARPSAAACSGCCKHQRRLHVAVAVQARGQAEVALEEGTHGTEEREDGVGLHVLRLLQIRFEQREDALVFVGPARLALEGVILGRVEGQLPVILAQLDQALRRRIESWAWTLTSTRPWQMSSAPFSPSAK